MSPTSVPSRRVFQTIAQGADCYAIGIDGTQNIAFSDLWDEHLLQRRIGPKVDPDSDEAQSYQYYVYVLEASLCFRNGRQSSP